jgi:hypothetical protein
MNRKMVLLSVALSCAVSGCATFRDACKSEVTLIRQYGSDIEKCTDDLRNYSNRLGRDWVEIGDRVYIYNRL